MKSGSFSLVLRNVLIFEAFHFLFQYRKQFIVQHSSALPNSSRTIFLLSNPLSLSRHRRTFCLAFLPVQSFAGLWVRESEESPKKHDNKRRANWTRLFPTLLLEFVCFFFWAFQSFGTDYQTGGCWNCGSIYLHNFLLNILSASVLIFFFFRFSLSSSSHFDMINLKDSIMQCIE